METQPGGADGFPGEKRPESALTPDNEKAAVDLFYEKLGKLNESSGLSLVFNLRDTMLDLHCFYKEVIKRGGFYQVTKMGKWDDVASVSNLKSSVSMPAAQLQNIYNMLILQYELMYFRKTENLWPAENSLGLFGTRMSPSCSKGKRKNCDSSFPFKIVHLGDRDCQTDKKDHHDGTWLEAKGPESSNKNPTMIIPPSSNVKQLMVEKRDAPLKPRTGYQIFLALESGRLKKIHGESSNSQNIRKMAVSAWRCLPEKDKLPFIEASKMDKERYAKEMASYKQPPANHMGKSQTVTFSSETPTVLNFSTSTGPDDVYRVSLQDDSEELHSPDESMVKFAVEAMKNAESQELIFQID